MNNLEDVARRVSVCTDCILSKQRTRAVPGEGSSNASIIFIGEGPGFHEDRQGMPFVGPAGKFLSELLDSVGMKREEVFITNVVKCRPPGNRDPLPGEIQEMIGAAREGEMPKPPASLPDFGNPLEGL